MGAMTYHAASKQAVYLDADFDSPSDPSAVYQPGDPKGKKVAIPGLVAGLDALWKKHGKLAFAELVQPAITLADEGFVVSAYYAAIVDHYADVLRSSEYGKKTFFPDGEAIKAGAILKQPEVAAFLRSLASEGAAYMYGGPWGEQLVAEVAKHGGKVSLTDMRSYEAA